MDILVGFAYDNSDYKFEVVIINVKFFTVRNKGRQPGQTEAYGEYIPNAKTTQKTTTSNRSPIKPIAMSSGVITNQSVLNMVFRYVSCYFRHRDNLIRLPHNEYPVHATRLIEISSGVITNLSVLNMVFRYVSCYFRHTDKPKDYHIKWISYIFHGDVNWSDHKAVSAEYGIQVCIFVIPDTT